jgi:hypothetical protein
VFVQGLHDNILLRIFKKRGINALFKFINFPTTAGSADDFISLLPCVAYIYYIRETSHEQLQRPAISYPNNVYGRIKT